MFSAPPRARPHPKTQSRSRFTEDLRRRCVVRAARQRADIVLQRRTAGDALSASQIIAAELLLSDAASSSSQSADASPTAWTESDEAQLLATLGREAYLELMAATEQSMLRELEAEEEASRSDMRADEEAAAAREYEAYLAEQEALMEPPPFEGADGSGGGSSGGEGSILCPLCVHAPLALSPEGFVVCCGGACPLRLDARGHPAPLDLLRERMDTLLREHGQRCRAAPSCRLPMTATEQQQLGHLVFTCAACGTCCGVV